MTLVSNDRQVGAFRSFLRKGGRSPAAIERCVALVGDFERWSADLPNEEAASTPAARVAGFAADVESRRRKSAKGHLWALAYYFDFTGDAGTAEVCRAMRRERVSRTPTPLSAFEGVDPGHLRALASAGIGNADEMLTAAATEDRRRALSTRLSIPVEKVTEIVRLCDLARIPGVKGIRARLYFDAGVDTLDRLSSWDPVALQAFLVDFVEASGFDGIAPTPAETAFTVACAAKLERVVED